MSLHLLLFRISLTSSVESFRPSIIPPVGAVPGVYFRSFRAASGPWKRRAASANCFGEFDALVETVATVGTTLGGGLRGGAGGRGLLDAEAGIAKAGFV